MGWDLLYWHNPEVSTKLIGVNIMKANKQKSVIGSKDNLFISQSHPVNYVLQ